MKVVNEAPRRGGRRTGVRSTIAPVKGVAQLWRVDLGGRRGLDLTRHAAPVQVTRWVLDLGGYKLSPDGKQVLLSMTCSPTAPSSPARKKRLDERARDKATGTSTTRSSSATGTPGPTGGARSCSSPASTATGRSLASRAADKGIDGDVPSKPFGDDSEYAFSPDGRTVYFDARIAGKTEPWSTNFDIYSRARATARPRRRT